MALSLGMLQEAVSYIKLAVEVYQEIQAVPGEVAELKTELEGLGPPLNTLVNLLKETGKPLPELDDDNRTTLALAVKQALADCKEVHTLFSNLESRHIGFVGGQDLKVRTDWLARVWYRWGVGADQVKALMGRINKRRSTILFILVVANYKPKEYYQEQIADYKKQEAALKKTQSLLEKLLKSANKDANKKDGKLKSMSDELKATNARLDEVLAALTGARAEAKRAKERECVDTPATKPGTGQAKKEKAQSGESQKQDTQPPGPGKLTKTPSMGPKIIRGLPESQKAEDGSKEPKKKAKKEKKEGQTDDKKEKKEGQTDYKKEKKTTKTNGDNKLPVIIQVEPQPAKKGKSPRPSPSPSPRPPRGEYSVLFVDPENVGRGVVCQAMLCLLQYSARSNGDRSPIAQAQSAGFFVKSEGNCTGEIDQLEYALKSYRLSMVKGRKPMLATARELLFQPDADGTGSAPWWQGCAAEGKAELERIFADRKSVGIRREHFAEFDYIVCFTAREHENLLRLRAAVVAKDGQGARPKGKGRILHLGRYLASDGGPAQEILTVKDPLDRETWGARIAQLKTALEGFLKQELKWDQGGRSSSK